MEGQRDKLAGRRFPESTLQEIAQAFKLEQVRDKYRQIRFEAYWEMALEDPRLVRNAYQQLYDMILSHGTTVYKQGGKECIRYGIFDDPFGQGRDAIYGIDEALKGLVDLLDAAAKGLGPERRIILLHGPVATAKSTIGRLFRRGLEAYSRSDNGRLYTFEWEVSELCGDRQGLCKLGQVQSVQHKLAVQDLELGRPFSLGIGSPHPVQGPERPETIRVRPRCESESTGALVEGEPRQGQQQSVSGHGPGVVMAALTFIPGVATDPVMAIACSLYDGQSSGDLPLEDEVAGHLVLDAGPHLVGIGERHLWPSPVRP